LLKKELRDCGVKYEGNNQPADKLAAEKLVPSKRMAQRLGISDIYYADAPLQTYNALVDKVVVLLSQHIGAPATTMVKVGDVVKCGERIGMIPERALGANVHASIDGKVVAVDEYGITIEKK
jgi:hypothetical protein